MAPAAELEALNGAVLHGLDLSYFTGKLQAYLRYIALPHRFAEMDVAAMRRAARHTGMAQMPALELADGRWMTDSTAIIAWIEARRDPTEGRLVIPRDGVASFFSRLVEDYADEWLWRPALHYRWSYEKDARLMGWRIASEMMRDVKAPLLVRRALIIRRQRAKYLTGDGVTASTRAHIESIYINNLRWLEAILEVRPYLWGDRPTLADFGYFASMFRHFSLDPTPARIMRDTAPNVYAWTARLWAARASRTPPGAVSGPPPADWSPIIADIGRSYLPYLAANARAAASGTDRFDVTLGDGAEYAALPVNRYRIAQLDRLQKAFEALPDADQAVVRARLEADGAWDPLWAVTHPASDYDPDGRAPFLTPDKAWAGPRRRRGRAAHDGEAR